MAGEPERSNRPMVDRGQDLDEILTPETRETLSDLALLSEKHAELSAALVEADRTMSLLVERHPEFNGPSSELRVKMTQLHDLQSDLAKRVMRFSHAYEDAVVAAGKPNRE